MQKQRMVTNYHNNFKSKLLYRFWVFIALCSFVLFWVALYRILKASKRFRQLILIG